MKGRVVGSAVVVALTATAAVGVFAIASGFAATTTKPYTAFFAPAPPSSIPAGSAHETVTLTLTNLASPQGLGSANVNAAALGSSALTINGASPAQYIDSAQTFPTSVLRLRNLGVAPNGGTRQITLDVATPCTSGVYTWELRAKQSNDFSGPPGNDFSFQTDGSNLTTSVAGGGGGTPAGLVFTQQPSDAVKNTAISPAVRVQVVDSCGNQTTSAGDVSLALQAGDTTFGGGGQLEGTTPTNLSNGLFAFPNLFVTESGFGYTLRASLGSLVGDSDPFNVYDALCPPFASCTASGNGTQIGIQGFDGSAGLSVGPIVNDSSCGSGLKPLGSTFAIVPQGAVSGTYTATLTLDKPSLQGVGVANIVVCVAASPGDALQRLSKCPKKLANPPKCILSQSSSNAGDAVITMLFNGDPVGGGFG